MNVKSNNQRQGQVHFKRLGRELAMQYLFQSDVKGDKLGKGESYILFWQQAVECDDLPKNRIFRKGREYADKMLDGIIEHVDELDKEIEKYSEKWDISRMSIVDRNVMRVALYEMCYCPDIPPVVSINEAVEIAKEFSSENSGNFVNGILNSIKDDLDRPPREAVDKL